MYNYHGDYLVPNYIEYVFLENLIINYLIIYQVSIFTKNIPKKANKLIGIAILTFYSVVNYYFNSVSISILTKILTVSFTIYIIYVPKKIKIYLKLYIYYFSISFLLVGIVISITLIFNLKLSNLIVRILIYFISGTLLFLFNKFMWKLWKSKIKNDNLIYTLKIKDILIKSFIDTGNNVYDYANNVDVIFVEKKFLDILNTKKLLYKKMNININTVIENKECEGYIVKNVKVLKNNKEIYEFKKLAFVFINKNFDNNEYNALISYGTYVDKLKGVVLC